MKYDLFLFDLDDTLLNFKESEKLSFFLSLQDLGIKDDIHELFKLYQVENNALWKLFEQGLTSKDHLKVERFRKVFDAFNIDINPQLASQRYLETLPETVVLMDYAEEICDFLASHGEIGIITNGIHQVQTQRINNSKIKPYISFVSVSDMCGHAKPDPRFFEFSAKMAKKFTKEKTIIIGDRFDADIVGAHNFGIDSCWFNPHKHNNLSEIKPTFEIEHLSEIKSSFR
jgi:YjjG family noncanonical pyrimidine nucleotidase